MSRHRPEGSESTGAPTAGSRALAIASAAPWRRAPLLLTRFPGVLVGVLVAGLVLGVAAAATPLFLDAAGHAALQRMRDARCPYQVGLTVTSRGPMGVPDENGVPADAILTRKDAAITRAVAGVPALAPPVRTVVGPSVSVLAPDGVRTVDGARLVTRSGALDHVRRLTPPPAAGSPAAEGVWIADSTAARAGLTQGSTLLLQGPGGRTSVPVAGIYADLASEPRSAFWCSSEELVYPPSIFSDFIPPPLVIVPDERIAASMGGGLQETDAEMWWEFPLVDRPLALPAAAELGGRLQAIADDVFGQGDSPHDPLALAFASGGTFRPRGDPGASTQLPGMVERARAVRSALRASIGSVSFAGLLLALMVIGAAGAYWVDRREAEVRLLMAKGAGPAAIAGKAALEVTLPIALAVVAGSALAALLIRALGPSPIVAVSSLSGAARTVAVAFVGALALLGLVAGVSAGRLEREPRGRRLGERVSRAPWELAVLALAAASYYELRSQAALALTPTTDTVRVDVLLLLFPLLLLVGVSGVVVRCLRVVLPRLRAAGDDLPTPLYLASRRLTGAPRSSQTLVLAAAVAIGILSLAPMLATSLRSALDDKALLYTGTDVVAPTSAPMPVPPALAGRATEVVAARSSQISANGAIVDVIGVDRRTFADGAFWRGRFADDDLDTLLRRLDAPGSGGAVPVLAVGDVPARTELRVSAGGDQQTLAVEVEARPRLWPGMRGDTPVIVVRRDRLPSFLPTEMWVRAPMSVARPVLAGAGVQMSLARAAADVRRSSDAVAVDLTFGFVEALGALAGLVAVVGLVLYLEERQRVREVSYALSRRMGLTRRAHLASVVIELAAMLGIATLTGCTVAWVAARAVADGLDTQPSVPPAPALVVPGLLVPTLVAGAVAVAVVGALFVQRRADRARLAEVLRRAG